LHCFKRLLFSICLLLVAMGWTARAKSQEGTTADVPGLLELVDQVVDLRLTDDSIIANAMVSEFKPGKLDNSLKSLKVVAAKSKRPVSVTASRIDEIFIRSVPLDVLYDKKNRCLVCSTEKKQDRLEHQRMVTERLSASRDRYWKPLTPDEQEAFMVEHRQFLANVSTSMPHIQFRLVETEFFLFYTNLPPAEVNGYIVYLDAMYQELCKAFGLSSEKNIWCGKCVVIAFGGAADYFQFETAVMANPESAGTQGMCHQSSDGNVIFAGYKGDNGFFGHVLVHETSHGFVHRYLSTARAPSWLNEGISDWLADVIVKGDSIPRRQKMSAVHVARTGGWGDFLTTNRIDGEHYGAASTLVQILISLDKGRQFRQFFDGIKEGKPADESLKDSFGISYQDLEILYARRISNMK
jgi:hypothetical protein